MAPGANSIRPGSAVAAEVRRLILKIKCPRRMPRLLQTPEVDFAFPYSNTRGYLRRMALVRILVDGYSLLHSWPGLAPGKPRHSAAARDELIRVLTLYQDTAGTPITIFFDGSGTAKGPSEFVSRPEVEILFSRSGQTADDLIERAAHRFRSYGEVMAVTDDNAERETVIALGG